MRPRRYRNKGQPPKDKTVPLWIEWANGMTSHYTYTADKLVWDLRGWDFDIAFYWRADGQGEVEPEQPKHAWYSDGPDSSLLDGGVIGEVA